MLRVRRRLVRYHDQTLSRRQAPEVRACHADDFGDGCEQWHRIGARPPKLINLISVLLFITNRIENLTYAIYGPAKVLDLHCIRRKRRTGCTGAPARGSRREGVRDGAVARGLLDKEGPHY